jgi:hypothetical protein
MGCDATIAGQLVVGSRSNALRPLQGDEPRYPADRPDALAEYERNRRSRSGFNFAPPSSGQQRLAASGREEKRCPTHWPPAARPAADGTDTEARDCDLQVIREMGRVGIEPTTLGLRVPRMSTRIACATTDLGRATGFPHRVAHRLRRKGVKHRRRGVLALLT